MKLCTLYMYLLAYFIALYESPLQSLFNHCNIKHPVGVTRFKTTFPALLAAPVLAFFDGIERGNNKKQLGRGKEGFISC